MHVVWKNKDGKVSIAKFHARVVDGNTCVDTGSGFISVSRLGAQEYYEGDEISCMKRYEEWTK